MLHGLQDSKLRGAELDEASCLSAVFQWRLVCSHWIILRPDDRNDTMAHDKYVIINHA